MQSGLDSEFFTPLELAVHATVKEYVDPRTGNRGAVALAQRVGISSSLVSNRANPTIPDARLGLFESATWQVVTDDYRILHAYAATLGHCAYQLPIAPTGGDMEILSAYVAVHEVAGRKAHSIASALHDGRVSAAERTEIRAITDDLIRASLELVACLERMQ